LIELEPGLAVPELIVASPPPGGVKVTFTPFGVLDEVQEYAMAHVLFPGATVHPVTLSDPDTPQENELEVGLFGLYGWPEWTQML
jgi:hypothetical protein